MNYREFRPAGAAGEFVRCYWVLEDDGREASRVQRIVPDGAAELILNFAQPFESFGEGGWRAQPRCFLAGQITGPLLLRAAGPARVLGIRFTPHGAGQLLGAPMAETANSLIPADDLSPVLARGLDRAGDFASPARQVAAVESALVWFKRAHGRDDPLIGEAVRQIAAGRTDVGGVAALLGISSRQLERRFLRMVGLPPKLFCRMRRFQRVLQAVDGGCDGWADAAVNCGYYDQAHLIRDFKEFTGETPSALLAGADLAEHFLTHRDVAFFQD